VSVSRAEVSEVVVGHAGRDSAVRAGEAREATDRRGHNGQMERLRRQLRHPLKMVRRDIDLRQHVLDGTYRT
jgi:hypothetical protein